jgi:predicted membrane-bound spermidine synthase
MSRARVIALLLFASGACALAYQIAWLRMLRLVFGASMAASAAVLAIFMGGLGIGGALLGRRADRARNPLALYAALEASVALAAALSPLLIDAVRAAYVAVGGTFALGPLFGTAVRLGLSALVLGVPTVLMGGTLPAAVRAAERHADLGRRATGLLYGVNTLGAVAGSLCANFVLLESLGTRATVWVTCAVNLVPAAAAAWLARGQTVTVTERAGEPAAAAAPTGLVLAAAAVVGWAFLLMELVWYRMLAPLLGGSSYTFGLILSVALLGIGLGGWLYAQQSEQRRPTLLAFAVTCGLEAVFMALPYAIGDGVAVLAWMVRPLGHIGFAPLVLSWTLIALLVVFPAAVVAGYQFPLLVGLLGAGAAGVGREVGSAYAWNTAGAIAASLAGGFGLIPLLGAPIVWQLVVVVLGALAVAAIVAAQRERAAWRRSLVPLALAAASLWLCSARGPTAFWRHTPIGAGRVPAPFASRNELHRMMNEQRRHIRWQADGIESTVAIDSRNAIAFLVQGKSDGNAISDAPTQVMSGLIAALLHPEPRTALVIGLGTGSTAGWLAQVPSIERVDVVELEPAILHVAALCSPVNHDVLRNPKVRVIIGDGREFLLTTTNQYDVIFSEPSNPYRAGVASLFTQEFYAAAARRLTAEGVLAQWVQAYEVQAPTLRTVYATLAGVFASVETWEVKVARDLLLIARAQSRPHDSVVLARRVREEPYRSALQHVWGVDGLAGLYTGFVASDRLIPALQEGVPVNTDDRTLIEFEFARTLGLDGLFRVGDLRALAAARGAARPDAAQDAVDWAIVEELRSVRAVAEGVAPEVPPNQEAELTQRIMARRAFVHGRLPEVRGRWMAQHGTPLNARDAALVAEAFAAGGDVRALDYLDQVRALSVPEAETILAQLRAATRQVDAAVTHLDAAFRAARDVPWAYPLTMNRALELAWNLTSQTPAVGPRLYEGLQEPFAVRLLDAARIGVAVNIALGSDFAVRCVAALAPFEPDPIWERPFLEQRERCYREHQRPQAPQARADLDAFVAASAPPLAPAGGT